MDEKSYHIINRLAWQEYRKQLRGDMSLHLSQELLDRLISLNDELTVEDALEVYEPITQLIGIYRDNYYQLSEKRNQFLGIKAKTPPFMIAISGSVAVGKSTTARLLRLFLSQAYPDLEVSLVTTDGFLYPNKILKERGLMQKKGFPESYDMPNLIQFLTDIKNNREHIAYPYYSHEKYDVVAGEMCYLERPEIVIVEGINVLQLAEQEQIFVGDFADLSIYVDAAVSDIERWYLERFKLLMKKAENEPQNHHHKYVQMPYEDAIKQGQIFWNTVNLVNLENYILPTRNRADMVIHKSGDHYIDAIWMKKY